VEHHQIELDQLNRRIASLQTVQTTTAGLDESSSGHDLTDPNITITALKAQLAGLEQWKKEHDDCDAVQRTEQMFRQILEDEQEEFRQLLEANEVRR
jgi:hypothetical protein